MLSHMTRWDNIEFGMNSPRAAIDRESLCESASNSASRKTRVEGRLPAHRIQGEFESKTTVQ
eukprot:jgi/Botrbrau1/14479/Bobra.0014s0115.1